MSDPVWSANFNNSRRLDWDETDNPNKRNGKVEWLRFIHNFHSLGTVFGEVTFGHDFTHEEVRRRYAYVEQYNDFKVFLANDEGWARIECFNFDLVKACIKAYAMTQESYRND